MTTKAQINKQIVQILQSNPVHQATRILLQKHQSIQNQQIKFHYRQPILYLFENQHDWQSMLKCLKIWQNMNNFQRGFYERMVGRLGQQPDKTLNDMDIRKQLRKLVDKHNAMNNIAFNKSLVQGLDKYLVPNKKKQGQGVNQMKKNEIKNNQEIIKQNKQKMTKNQQNNIEEKSQNSTILNQSMSLANSRSLQINNKSNHSAPSSLNNHTLKPSLRRITLGGQNNRPSTFDKVISSNRFSSRLTFGGRDNLNGLSKNIVNLAKKHGGPIEQVPGQEENNEKNQNQKKQINMNNSHAQNNVKKKTETQVQFNPKQQRNQQNKIFDKKQIQLKKTNNIYLTQKKQQTLVNKNTQQQFRSVSRSISRSLTPNKPIVQRKKIQMKRVNTHHIPNNLNKKQINYFDSQQKNNIKNSRLNSRQAQFYTLSQIKQLKQRNSYSLNQFQDDDYTVQKDSKNLDIYNTKNQDKFKQKKSINNQEYEEDQLKREFRREFQDDNQFLKRNEIGDNLSFDSDNSLNSKAPINNLRNQNLTNNNAVNSKNTKNRKSVKMNQSPYLQKQKKKLISNQPQPNCLFSKMQLNLLKINLKQEDQDQIQIQRIKQRFKIITIQGFSKGIKGTLQELKRRGQVVV